MVGERLIRVLILCGMVIGCSEQEAAGPMTAEGDAIRWEVELEPRIQLGVASGDPLQEFHGVTTPFLLPDGRIVVPQRTGVIRVFDAEGRFIDELGAPGEGPGEFATLRSAWARGDTIEAVDSRLQRITRFLPGGELEVVSLRGPVQVETAVPGAFPEGWVATGFGAAGAGLRDEMILHRFSEDGGYLGELGRVDGLKRISGSGVAGAHPLSPRAVMRVSGDEVFVAETETARIEVMDFAGTVTRKIEWEVDHSGTPAEALELVRDAPRNSFYEALIVDAEVPERLSVFWDFLVDEPGFVWIRPYEPSKHALGVAGREEGGGRWLILSPEGTEVGSVEMPEGLRPAQITTKAVVGIHVDSLGVESVRVHDLHRD